MPLLKSKSEKAFGKNIHEMMKSKMGKSHGKAVMTYMKKHGVSKKKAMLKIALAAAYSQKRK